MARFDKAKLLKARDNIDRYLRKAEMDEKDRYERLALSFKNTQATVDRILARLEGDKDYERIVALLEGLKRELGEAIKSTKVDMEPVVKAVDNLADSIARAYSSKEVVASLSRLEKLLSKGPKKEKVKDRTDEIVKAIKDIKVEAKDIEFPKSISVDNFPPTKTPLPVTNININPLRGLVHVTTTTVGTTLKKLPGYGELENRRSIIFYNNDSSATLYIGGSNVTTSNGMPVEPKSYSPSFDSGPLQKWYGVSSSGTIDVRCIEVANDTGA